MVGQAVWKFLNKHIPSMCSLYFLIKCVDRVKNEASVAPQRIFLKTIWLHCFSSPHSQFKSHKTRLGSHGVLLGGSLISPTQWVYCCAQWVVGLTTVMTHAEIVVFTEPLYASNSLTVWYKWSSYFHTSTQLEQILSFSCCHPPCCDWCRNQTDALHAFCTCLWSFSP